MEELARLITVISLHTDVDRTSILQGKSKKATTARDILCHTVNECYPHLMKTLCDMTCVCKSAIYKAEARASLRIDEDPALRRFVNNIRRDLCLPPIKKEIKTTAAKVDYSQNVVKKNAEEIPASQLIFGFKWSDKENVRIWGAETDSVIFMNKYCKMGKQPIAEGMVTTRQRPTTWYHNLILYKYYGNIGNKSDRWADTVSNGQVQQQ